MPANMEYVFCLPVFVMISAVVCDAKAYRPSCRKVEEHERVSCGYPGISKKECLKDCHCCFDDNAYKNDAQCFFRDVPPVVELCCDVKRRIPCRLKNKDLENDPYTCRQMGCCFDDGGWQKPVYGGQAPAYGGHKPIYGGDEPVYGRHKPAYGGRRRRRGRRGKYRRRGYGYGNGNEYGYSHLDNQPRCFKTSRNCCRALVENVDSSERKMASYGSVSRRQCLRNRNACWDGRDKPHCFYKFNPCRCPVNSLKCRPCGDEYEQNRLDNSYGKCIAAGCCYRASSSQNKCIKPRRRRRGRNAADEDYGMDDPDYSNYEYYEDETDSDDVTDDDEDNPLMISIVNEEPDSDEAMSDEDTDADKQMIEEDKDEEMTRDNVQSGGIKNNQMIQQDKDEEMTKKKVQIGGIKQSQEEEQAMILEEISAESGNTEEQKEPSAKVVVQPAIEEDMEKLAADTKAELVNEPAERAAEAI